MTEVHPASYTQADYAKHKTQDIAANYLINTRGFPAALIQGIYQNGRSFNNIPTARFFIKTDNGHIYWERLIGDLPEGTPKSLFQKGTSFTGFWWQHPKQNLIEDTKEAAQIWITEGIFNALALINQGYKAVAAMSSHSYPAVALQKLAAECAKNNRELPQLVIAFDSDNSGINGAKKFIKKAKENGWDCLAAVPPPFKDWNDLHLEGKLTAADMNHYLAVGAEKLADNYLTKAKILAAKIKRKEFPFEFDHCLYWCEKVRSKNDDDELNINVTELANFVVQILSLSQAKDSRDNTYSVKILFNNGRRVEEHIEDFKPSELNRADWFADKVSSVCGGFFHAESRQLKLWLKPKKLDIKRIQSINYYGYVKEHECYIFPKVAFYNGKTILPEPSGEFRIGTVYLKTTADNAHLKLDPKNEYNNVPWFSSYYIMYGARGVIALAYWMGSLFATQIRQKYGSYPFLEISGEGKSGKTTQIEFLWKLFGFENFEGTKLSSFNPNARARFMAQSANIPIVCVESDDAGGRKDFDFDSFKTYYNGFGGIARGIKDHTNNIDYLPFNGTLVFVQNSKISASIPTMQRIIHIPSDRKKHTPETETFGEILKAMTVAEVSGFIFYCLKHEKEIMRLFDEKLPVIKEIINDGFPVLIKHKPVEHKFNNQRVVLNWAQIIAFVEILCDMQILHRYSCTERDTRDTPWYPIPDDDPNRSTDDFDHIAVEATEEAIILAIKNDDVAEKDDPVVEQFWDFYEYAQAKGVSLNHINETGKIAINLNHALQVAAEYQDRDYPKIKVLRNMLKTSKRYKYIEGSSDNRIISCIKGFTQLRVMMFKTPS